MLPSIAADERAELHYCDLAGAIDAGLPLAALGGDAAAGDRALHAAVRSRGVRMTPTEDVMLLHGWRAGKAAATLRACADGRRQRAEFGRAVWTGVRYPLVLALALPLVALGAATFTGPRPLLAIAAVYACAAAAVQAVRRAARSGAAWLRRLPAAAGLLDAAAEIPYLETLHALYGAGVPLLQAHAAAVAAAPPGQAAARMKTADAVLRQGRPLHEGLAAAVALHQETRALLLTGERSGQLEDALSRALQRRRDVHGRALATLGRTVGGAAYTLAALAVLWLAANFYVAYIGRLGQLLGGR